MLGLALLEQGSVQFILLGVTIIAIWVVLLFTTSR
jgi:hypothetical protein